jgi:hypothetical protein
MQLVQPGYSPQTIIPYDVAIIVRDPRTQRFVQLAQHPTPVRIIPGPRRTTSSAPLPAPMQHGNFMPQHNCVPEGRQPASDILTNVQV